MRSYLLIRDEKNEQKDSYCFKRSAHYAERLAKDTELYGVNYILYDRNQKVITEQGDIRTFCFNETKETYEAVLENKQLLNQPLNIEVKEQYQILPLSKSDLKTLFGR